MAEVSDGHGGFFQHKNVRYFATLSMVALVTSMAIYTSYADIAAYAISTWAKKLGGSGTDDMFRGIERLSDGYVVVGSTNSFGAGAMDAFVIKVDDDGNIISQRTFGGKGGDTARVVKVTPDGGFVVGGITHSFSSGGADFWVTKFDSNENLQWSKSYGGPNNDMAHAIDVTLDGGYLVGGFTTSYGAVSKDYFVVKLDSAGNQQWAKRFGGSGEDVIRIVKATSDGKYLVAGFTHSFGTKGDIMIIKLDGGGNIEWQKRYGGSAFEEPCCILEMPDGYIILEQSASFGGGAEAWVFKIDANGDILWQKRHGGSSFDELSSARLTDDGGFIAAGETRSFNAVVEDYWLVKFSAQGMVEWAKRYGGSDIDEAEAIALGPDGGMVAVGTTKSFGAQGEDVWLLKVDASGNVAGCDADVTANQVTQTSTSNTNAVPANTAVTVGTHTVSVKNASPAVSSTNANIVVQCSAISENNPPLAGGDTYDTSINTQLIVPAPGVLGNDDDPDGDPLSASLASQPSHGTVTMNSDGSFTYDPTLGFSGEDSFGYRANDGELDSNIANVFITVSNVNSPPTANPDSYSTDKDTFLNVAAPGVLDNDQDSNGDPLTTSLVSGPSSGTLNLNDNGGFSYDPNAGFTGQDSFSYSANDGQTDSNIVTVTITVSEVQSPPVANDQTVLTNGDTPVDITLTGHDNQDPISALTFYIASLPIHGSLSDTAGDGISTLKYVPSDGFTGTDSFTFMIRDSAGAISNTATVTINIDPVNGNPVAADKSA
jgi:hypothetical protein